MAHRIDTLLPRPYRAEPVPGSCPLPAAATIAGPPPLTAALRRALPAQLALEATVTAEPHAAAGAAAITVVTDARLPAEGYRLTVLPGGVQIAAAGPTGAFYAGQTLRQLLPDDAWRAARADRSPLPLPCATIEDRPALPWRGVLLDVARHFFAKHTVLRYIDLLAAHKLNRLHLHLTDDQGWRIASDAHPEIARAGAWRAETQIGHGHAGLGGDGTPHGGCYTLADLAEITAYAAQRAVTVVPEVDLPGHAGALLASHPELGIGGAAGAGAWRRWGVGDAVLRPLPETARFVTELLDELITAVPTGYLHLGGDEVPTAGWATDPDVDAYRRRLHLDDVAGLHGRFLRGLADTLADRGCRSLVWDEAFAAGGLREDTIVMCWTGLAAARRAAAAGHQVVATPVMPCYLDYAQAEGDDEPLAIGGPITLHDVAGHRVVPADWPAADAARVLGGQVHLWSEYIEQQRQLDYQAWPRACAFADAAWSGERSDTGRVAAHLPRLAAAGVEYRPPDGPLPWQRGGTGRRAHHPGLTPGEG